jgi:hypothetical protein
MGKPDYEEFLSGIPAQPDDPKKPDAHHASASADKTDTKELPGTTEQSNTSDPVDLPDQPDLPGPVKQSGQSSQSKQADLVSKANQPSGVDKPNKPKQSKQSTPPRRADQPGRAEQSSQPDRSKQAGQPEQSDELITFSVRMPTSYIDAIKAITWWERRTHRAFIEGAVDRYRHSHGQAHLTKILSDYHANN